MRVCMLLERDRVLGDNRVRRELRALVGAGHDVVLLHRGPRDAEPGLGAEAARMRTVLPRRPRARAALTALPGPLRRVAVLGCFAWRAARSGADAVHAHDPPVLAPAALAAAATGAKLVYDTHEYAEGVPYHSPGARWAVRTLQRVLLPRCSAIIAVAEGTAAQLQADHGLARRPAVVRNVPERAWYGSEPAPDLRAQLGIPAAAPLVLHQGAAMPDRGLPELVDAVALLPDAHLLLLGDALAGCDEALRRRAAERGIAARVHQLASVPVEQLLAHTRQADVGVCLFDPAFANHRLTLPNKVFEYIAAGLPVVASAETAFADLVERLGVGYPGPFGDAAGLARALGAALAGARDPAVRERIDAARAELDWSLEQQRLIDVYAGLGARAAG